MPNTFKLKTVNNIGTSDSDIYTVPSATQTTVIGMNLANITSGAITADITLVNNDGPNISIVKSAPIPVGGSLVAIGGDQKLVMEATDVLKLTASGETDIAVSIMEIT